MNAAKIAAIASHTAPLLTRDEAPRCIALIPCLASKIPCSAAEIPCSGCADFPLPDWWNISKSLFRIDKSEQMLAPPGKIPCTRQPTPPMARRKNPDSGSDAPYTRTRISDGFTIEATVLTELDACTMTLHLDSKTMSIRTSSASAMDSRSQSRKCTSGASNVVR